MKKTIAEIARLFREGSTLREIGSRYGVSGERIRQILFEHGIGPHESGRHVKARRRFEELQERIAKNYLRKYGCSAMEFKTIPLKARRAFNCQRQSSRRRRIEWKLSMWEWWNIWVDSGKWEQRGLSGYCMARKGDVGPYSADNVYICTVAQNLKDGFVTRPYNTRIGIGRTAARERQ